MAAKRFQAVESRKNEVFFTNSEMGLPQWNLQDGCFSPGGLFASVGQVGTGFGISANPSKSSDNNSYSVKLPYSDLYVKCVISPEFGFRIVGIPQEGALEEELVKEKKKIKKKKGGFRFNFKVGNPSLRRLISGGIAGAVSRTVVAPLETIRTHLMVGSSGDSTSEVFHSIIMNDGWKGLFRGNLVNVIRVAPSKAIES